MRGSLGWRVGSEDSGSETQEARLRSGESGVETQE